jgi:hypothetical protein
VKLVKNASKNCAMLSEAYGGEARRKSSVFEWHKQFKENSHIKITNEDSEPSLLCGNIGHVKWCLEKGLNSMTMLQPTRCSQSSSFWPKNKLLKWN